MNKINYCPNCGNKVAKNDLFCGSCGEKLESKNHIKKNKDKSFAVDYRLIFVLRGILSYLIVLIGYGVLSDFKMSYWAVSFMDIVILAVFLTAVLLPFISIININLNLLSADNKKVSIKQIKNIFTQKFTTKTLKYLGSYLIYAACVITAFIIGFYFLYFLIVNTELVTFFSRRLLVYLSLFLGVFFAGRFIFFGYFIFDKNKGVFESLKNSYTYTKKFKLKIYFSTYLMILLNILAFMTIIGPIISVPASFSWLTSLYIDDKKTEKIKNTDGKLLKRNTLNL